MMKQRSSRWHARYAAICGTAGAGFVAFDVAEHFWPSAGITAAATAVNLMASDRNRRAAAAREKTEHRPDYAKIARLERELGLGAWAEPPPALKVNPAITPAAGGRGAPMSAGVVPKPDVQCAFCLPTGPPARHGCVFYPVCQEKSHG